MLVNALWDLARLKDDYSAARTLFEEALKICRELGNKQGVNCTLNNLGAVAFGQGDFEAACRYYSEALGAAKESREKATLSYSLDGFAALCGKRGKSEIAAQLAGAAEYLRESLGFEIEPAERRFRNAYLTKLRSMLGEETIRPSISRRAAFKTGKSNRNRFVFRRAYKIRNSIVTLRVR
ncbi:MAG: tetratricopeptide repeat protein [Acidobacteriota bacterium]|nr:tetratricopeptide repeat protein [Acidobacteriota bacterium]